MSTSKRKKADRQRQLAKEARIRELEAQGIVVVNRKSNRKKSEFKEYKPNETYRREDNQSAYKSLQTTACNTARKDGQQYTGDYVKGIMESHKSNLLPVVSDEHIVDITKMRRN